MMKLFVALALAAAMPSAHAMGKYNSCEDSAQCVEFKIEGPDRCSNDETRPCEVAADCADGRRRGALGRRDALAHGLLP